MKQGPVGQELDKLTAEEIAQMRLDRLEILIELSKRGLI